MLFYVFAVLCMVVASETYTRSGEILGRSSETSGWHSLYNLLGSVVAPALVVVLFIWGFIAYGWWVAPLVVIGISYVVSMAYAERMWHLGCPHGPWRSTARHGVCCLRHYSALRALIAPVRQVAWSALEMPVAAALLHCTQYVRLIPRHLSS